MGTDCATLRLGPVLGEKLSTAILAANIRIPTWEVAICPRMDSGGQPISAPFAMWTRVISDQASDVDLCE